MKAKKIITLIIAVVIMALMSFGCQSSPGSGTVKGGTDSDTKVGEKSNFNKSGYPIVNEKITVTSVFSPSPGWAGKPEELSVFKKLEEITNIHVEWKMLPAEQDTAVKLYLAAGDFPDFFRRFIGPEEQYKYGVEGGMFVDYSSMINEYMPNMVSWFKEFPEAKKIITQENGAIYTLPRIQKASTSAAGQMFVRTDYLEKIKKPIPKTVEEFYETLKAIKDANLTSGYAPLLPYNALGFNNQTEKFLFAAFGDSVDIDFAADVKGKVVYNRVSDQYKRYLEYMNKLFKEGLIEKELFTIDSETTLSRVKLGQAAFMEAAYNLFETDFSDGKIHIDCVAPLTSQYTNKQKVVAYPYVYSVGGAINKKSKYAKELLRMFDISFARKEVVPGSGLYGLSESTGLEGSDWNFTSADKTSLKINVPDKWKDKSVWQWISNEVTWGEDYGAVVLMATTGTGNTLARETGMINNNIKYAVVPFPSNDMKYKEEEKNIIANKMTDIQSYVIQMRAKFITGVEPLSKWDEYVESVKKMGLDTIIKQNQSAYDRWLKN